MRIPALVTEIPVQRMDSVLESDRHNVFVILDFLDNSANVSNVPHSIKPFSKVTYILQKQMPFECFHFKFSITHSSVMIRVLDSQASDLASNSWLSLSIFW